MITDTRAKAPSPSLFPRKSLSSLQAHTTSLQASARAIQGRRSKTVKVPHPAAARLDRGSAPSPERALQSAAPTRSPAAPPVATAATASRHRRPPPPQAMADPTPRTLHRAAAAEFGESWRSPGVQRYLGSEFGSPVAALQRDHGPSAEARLQSALAVAKEARAASSLGAHASHATDGSAGSLGGAIGAYRAGGPAPTAPAAPAASDLPAPGMGDALAADYRAQLQRYAQQLAAKDGEAAAMRAHTTELRQQLAAAEGRAARADEAAARRDAAATQLEAQAAALERQLAEREAELAAAATARRAAEQAAAAARATAAAAQKAAGGRAGQWEADRRNLQEQLERRDKELHRCA